MIISFNVAIILIEFHKKFYKECVFTIEIYVPVESEIRINNKKNIRQKHVLMISKVEEWESKLSRETQIMWFKNVELAVEIISCSY